MKQLDPQAPDWRLTDQSVGREPDSTLPDAVLWTDARGLVISRIGAERSDHFRLRFAPGMSFDVITAARLVRDSSTSPLPKAVARHMLADQVIPRVLAHAGRLILHAGAVLNGGQALVFLGNSGRGKSTLTASFDQAGFPLIGDDAMIISSDSDHPRAAATYPSLRLLPDSIAALLPPSAATEQVADYSAKRRVEVADANAGGGSGWPIQAIFSIAPPAADDEIAVKRLTVAQACMALVENSFALDPSDVRRARGRLDEAAALASRLPCFEISYPRDFARLAEVRAAIADALDRCAG